MSKISRLLILIIFFSTASSYAQPQVGQFIKASIGLGLNSPYDEYDMVGNGGYVQAEYIWSPKTWFGVRPYAGVVFASGEPELPEGAQNIQGYHIKSNAALLGAKIRLVAPIPYVAPFLEAGLGMSIGSFETVTPFTNVKKSGAIMHIPFSLGLAIGKNHSFEVMYTYYYHDSADQYAGAFAVGYTIPLNRGE